MVFYKTLVNIYKITWRHIPEDRASHSHHGYILKSQLFYLNVATKIANGLEIPTTGKQFSIIPKLPRTEFGKIT
jgi:hypothetical protein